MFYIFIAREMFALTCYSKKEIQVYTKKGSPLLVLTYKIYFTMYASILSYHTHLRGAFGKFLARLHNSTLR